jgi:hypothetical protein
VITLVSFVLNLVLSEATGENKESKLTIKKPAFFAEGGFLLRQYGRVGVADVPGEVG